MRVTIIVPITAVAGAAANNRKNITIKYCASFTNCISEKNNIQIDNAKDIDIVMPMNNLTEYSDNYSKTSGILWHYYRDKPFLHANGAIADFPADNNKSASSKFKTKIADRTGDDGRKNVKTRVPLKYLSNFWRTLAMPLINCEINLILTWSNTYFIIDNLIISQEQTFIIADTKLSVPVITLSTQDNAKLPEQLKSVFERTINWNRCEPKVTVEQQNRYLDLLISPSVQVVNRLFIIYSFLDVLSFQNNSGRTSHTRYYIPLPEVKNYNTVTDARNLFDQRVKNNLITYDNIRKITIGQENDYTTGCPLDYS